MKRAKDDPQPIDHSTYIGEKIREIRKSRGLTLVNLSKKSGLSVGYISLIERNLSQPTVESLMKIAEAMDVDSGMFFYSNGVQAKSDLGHVVREDERRVIKYSLGISDYLLVPDLSGNIEFLVTKLEPGASSGDQPYSHAAEVVGLVLSGTIDLWIDEEEFQLSDGDSFRCKSDTPHRYRNAKDSEAVLVLALSLPR